MNRREFTTTLMAATILSGCNDKESSSSKKIHNNISMKPNDWDIRFSHNMPPEPSASAFGGWNFDFPLKKGSVHYVTTRTSKKITKFVSAQFRIEALEDEYWDFTIAPDNKTGSPSSVGLFVQRRDDDMTAEGKKQFYRWWSRGPNGRVELKNGTFSLTIPLVMQQWTSVYGKEDQSKFEDCFANIESIGFTFGGGCCYGHGVRTTKGKAKFICTNFTAE